MSARFTTALRREVIDSKVDGAQEEAQALGDENEAGAIGGADGIDSAVETRATLNMFFPSAFRRGAERIALVNAGTARSVSS